MAECPTVKIQTGPDTYIIVNAEDHDAFKYMEYVKPIESAPKVSDQPETQEVIQTEETATSTRRRKTVEE
jgi:hypothetical protein